MSALLSDKEAAQRLGVSYRTMQRWRGLKSGPPFLRISSRCVRYREEDLKAWLQRRADSCEDTQVYAGLRTSTQRP